MSEELLQRDLIKNPEKIGKWNFYNIGTTSIKDLKKYGILRNVDYGNIEKKRVDAIITHKHSIIAIIEYKKPSEFKTVEQKTNAIAQEIEVAKKLGAKLIIATDTNESIWVNSLTGKQIKDENGQDIKDIFNPKDHRMYELIEKIYLSIHKNNNQIKPIKLVNPTSLAKQIWQDIWAVSGATPENCLYSFVELFIFKYLSDLNVLRGIYHFDSLINSFEDNTKEEVLENYASTIRPKIKELFPENTEDKTTIINGTIFVSKDQKAVKGYSTVFKKILFKFKNYGKLEKIDYDFKSQLFESFLKESISKKNWGQFFTPLKVIRPIIEMAKDEIKENTTICDPACGVGKFLLEPIITKLEHFYKISNNELIPKITIHGFDKGFDKDEQKTIILAKANMLIYFSDLIKENPTLTNEFSKLFNKSFVLKSNSILGTLSEPIKDKYDLILTNPPYVTSGSSNLKEEIKKNGKLIDYYKINAIGVEGLFMEWIIRALKPNGKAFIIIPDGILNRQNDKCLRKFILDECYLDGIISLPLNTFFTTNKKTYILCLTKKEHRKSIQKAPIFTYLVSEIGESRDTYRFETSQNDLQEAVTLYSFFKGEKQAFSQINTNNRCKIQPINKFIDNIETGWIIDRWWTDQEKISLGIVNENKKVTLYEFSSILKDVANSIYEFHSEIKDLAEKKKIKLKYKKFFLYELFHIKRGLTKYKKKYGEQNKGLFPVYSASNNKPLTYINTFDYEGKYLTWATNGFAGYIKIVEGKFSINADRGLLKPKHNNINIQYLKYQLEPIFRNLAKGRIGEQGEDEFTKLYPSMIKNITVKIPVNKHKELDILSQNRVANQLAHVENIKNKIKNYKEKINNILLEPDFTYNSKKLYIREIFDLSIKTNSSKFTKSFIEKYKGNIPVYSASKFTDFVNYGHVKDNLPTVNYFNDCLTWNIDGSIGKAHYRHGRFSLSEKVIPLIIKSTLKEKLDIMFLKYSIENEFNKYSFGFRNKAGKIKIKDIALLIPINSRGEFDLEPQIQMANKYKKIESIKATIKSELNKIENYMVDIPNSQL